MSKAKICVGICIGKNDLDIAAWFNMLKRQGLPLATWVYNVVNAFVSDRPLDIGTVCVRDAKKTMKPEQIKVHSNLMFGSGSSLMNDQEDDTHKAKEKGWSARGAQGEYIQGSTIPLQIYNEQTAFALKQMKNNGMSYSAFLKAVIREYLKTGEYDIPPVAASGCINLSSVDKNTLKLTNTNASKKSCKDEPTHKDEPTQENMTGRNESGQLELEKKSIQDPKPKTQTTVEKKLPEPIEQRRKPPMENTAEKQPKHRVSNPNPLLSQIQ